VSEAKKFNEVFHAELQQIDARRHARKLADTPPKNVGAPELEDVRKEAHKRELVGLAISGGGIRSATFGLGFLQGLAGLKMLKYFDYLSTVSGGGYIGAWLTAWIQRSAAEIRDPQYKGSPNASPAEEVEKNLRPVQEQKAAAADKEKDKNDPPLDPIEHLRRHSNYLAPRPGFLSIDTWVLLALYLRNFLLNQLVLLPVAVFVLLASRFVMFLYYPAIGPDGRLHTAYDIASGAFYRYPIAPGKLYALVPLVAALMGLAMVNMVRAIHAVRQEKDPDGCPKSTAWLLGRVVVPVGLAALLFCPLIPNASPWWIADPWGYVLFAALAIAVPYCIFSKTKFKPGILLGCLVTGLAWGAMLYGAYRIIDWFYEWDGLEPWHALQISATAQMTAFGPPLLLLTMVLAIYLAIGLLSKYMGEELREWHASLCAWLLVAAGMWTVINVLALYGTALVLWAGPWVQFALGSGWLLTVIGGVLAGSSDRTGAPRPQDIVRDVMARGSLYVFVVGILIIVSLLVHVAVDKPPEFDLVDDSIAPSRQVPKYGSTLLTVKRQNKDGKITTERKAEYQRVTDEAVAIGQQYWLGMLNTSDKARHPNFYFTDDDMSFLRNELAVKRRLIAKETLETRLMVLRLRSRKGLWEQDEIRRGLKKYLHLPDKDDDEVRTTIFWLVAAKKSPAEIVALRIAGLAGTPAGHLPILAASAPLPDATVEIEFSWDILSDALHASEVPAALQQKIKEKEIQHQLKEFNYRVWNLEELEDEVEKAFPEAWNEPVRRMIVQRVKGGTGPLVKIEEGKFLLRIAACAIGCLVVLLFAAYHVDVNDFSLHGTYVNRLVRGYLGASRKPARPDEPDPKKRKPDPHRRKPDPSTGFDPDDDLLLSALKSNANPSYDGPFPIVNAAMNLVHGGNLAWQERMAESFVFTPEFCGSETTGFQLTEDGERSYAKGLKLGTAMAISGAAASPNMGYHSSPAVTFLLTVFNARLGAWLGNPKDEYASRQRGPRPGFYYLFCELFGWTDEKHPYIYLSDGGHFENLGAYELIKRRCRYVVICDAGQDEMHGFEDLGNLVRLARIDLGIRIELAPDFLQLQKDSHQCRWHCAIGKIRYDEVDPGQAVGTLVYVKPSLTGDEPADVLHYAARHPSFPHETTANQFFTESQFESYRALGEHIAQSVFKQAIDEAKPAEPDTKRRAGAKRESWCRELFASLVRLWFAMPPEYDAHFVESTQRYIDLQDAWRQDPRLWRLTLDMYPELDPAGNLAASLKQKEKEKPDEGALREIAELHMLLQMLQVAEDAYLTLKLDKYYAHPLNRGWMDVLYRWASSETFRQHWPTLRGEFARDFVDFCERQMRMGEVTGIAVLLDREKHEELPPRLLREFAEEWPDYPDREDEPRTLRDILADKATMVWAIYPARTSAKEQNQAKLPAGFIAVYPKALPAPHNPKPYAMLMWLRGAYRNVGLGRPAIERVLKKLEKKLPRPFQLHVNLPAANLSGPGGRLQKEMWLSFFTLLKFKRTRPAQDEHETQLELHRDFRLPESPLDGA
jgi:hypothetical protein